MRGERKNSELLVVALSQNEMELEDRSHPFGKHIVISITCPDGERDARIKTEPKAILRLKFWDVEESREGYEVVFEHKDAKSVRRFVEKHVDAVDSIVVHCRAGVSRSVGCAAAIAKALLGDDETFYKQGRPNSRVYKGILKEFMKDGG
jgi:predicted protein tyrosine phosphatase